LHLSSTPSHSQGGTSVPMALLLFMYQFLSHILIVQSERFHGRPQSHM
jgi:hypothetical protein